MITVFIKNDALRTSLSRLLRRLGDAYGLDMVDTLDKVDPKTARLLVTDQSGAFIGDGPVLDLTAVLFPIRPSVLLSKIQNAAEKSGNHKNLKKIDLGVYIFKPHDFLLQSPDKGDIILTEKERDILLYIYKQAPMPVMRDDLLNAVWGYGDNIETHTLETHIYRLRQKIEKDPSAPQFLKTTDEGYCLQIDPL